MKKIRLLSYPILALVYIISFFPKTASASNEKLDSLIKECAIIFEEVNQMPDKGIPGNLLKNATGLAIFPSTLKGAFFLGGRYGEGIVLYRNPDTKKWSPPAFFTVTGLSFGWQVGGQAIDLIFVIPTERGFEGLLENKLNLGTNTALVAGPIGRNAELGADITLKGGIFTYSRAKGLFAGIGLKGLSISPNEAANRAYYGSDLTIRDILIHGKAEPSTQAVNLIKTISKYTE